jgi:hypothetical protein
MDFIIKFSSKKLFSVTGLGGVAEYEIKEKQRVHSNDQYDFISYYAYDKIGEDCILYICDARDKKLIFIEYKNRHLIYE